MISYIFNFIPIVTILRLMLLLYYSWHHFLRARNLHYYYYYYYYFDIIYHYELVYLIEYMLILDADHNSVAIIQWTSSLSHLNNCSKSSNGVSNGIILLLPINNDAFGDINPELATIWEFWLFYLHLFS